MKSRRDEMKVVQVKRGKSAAQRDTRFSRPLICLFSDLELSLATAQRPKTNPNTHQEGTTKFLRVRPTELHILTRAFFLIFFRRAWNYDVFEWVNLT